MTLNYQIENLIQFYLVLRPHHLINFQILKIGVKGLKKYVNIMSDHSFKLTFFNYWRIIDKKIFFCFIILFFLGIFFSFSSTSFLAGERLNKDYYFFFTKHLIFTFLALLIMISISLVNTTFLKKLLYLFLYSLLFSLR